MRFGYLRELFTVSNMISKREVEAIPTSADWGVPLLAILDTTPYRCRLMKAWMAARSMYRLLLSSRSTIVRCATRCKSTVAQMNVCANHRPFHPLPLSALAMVRSPERHNFSTPKVDPCWASLSRSSGPLLVRYLKSNLLFAYGSL
jgi:hypothetical protein